MSTIQDPRRMWFAFRPGPYPKHWLCSPHLPVQLPIAGGRCKDWATSLLAAAYSVFFFFPPLPVMLPSEIPHRPACERVFYCWETSPFLQLPPQDRSPSLTLLSLFLSFIFCPTSFCREWGAFLGAWCPPPAFRSCFVEVAQHSSDLLMNL